MSGEIDVGELELSDRQLVELLRNHGIDRRSLLVALGVGAASVGTMSGSAAADHDDPHPPQIDSHYGYSTPDAEAIPEPLEPDHVVDLLVIPPNPAEEIPVLFAFDPAGLHVEKGDIVQFTFTTPDHTVTSYHPQHGFQQRVPDGVPPFSSPIVSGGGAWLYEFCEAGVYDLYCGPHHILGMAMRIVVGDLDEDDVPDYVDTFEPGEDGPPLLPPFSKEELEEGLNGFSGENEGCEWPWLTPHEVLAAEALDPMEIQSAGEVWFTDVLEDVDRFDVEHVPEVSVAE